MHVPKRTCLEFVITIFLIILAAPFAQAQFRTAIQGTVTDSSGAVVPGAKLTLVDKQTNLTLNATSDANGIYNFNALPPSNFKLTTTMNGFQTSVMDDLKLNPEQSNNVNVVLSVGESSTSITVNADQVAALDAQTASINSTVNSNQIQHLPTMGRDVTGLTQLTLGVFGDSGQAAGGGNRSIPGSNMAGGTATSGIFKTENAPQIVANGGQNETNGIEIDGINTVSAVWGGATVITPSADSVENVKVTANAYDAEFGRFSGAQVQITSKSGTNNFHGSAFFRAERPGMNAYQRWNGPGGKPVRDNSRFNQFGGTIGGPIWKDKLFAFFAYETLRNNSVVNANSWFETPQFLASAPAASIASIYGNYPGEGVNAVGQTASNCSLLGLAEGTNCQTVSGGVDIGSPLRTGLGSLDPTYQGSADKAPGIGSGLDGIPDLAQYITANPSKVTQSQYNGRLDANISQKDRLSFIIYWVPQTSDNYQSTVRSANLWHHQQVNDAFTVLWNHTFSATLLNEARANAAGFRWNEITSNPNVPFGLAKASIGGSPSGLFPSATLQDIGTPGPSTLNQWTYGYQDIVTKIAGRHTLKMGGSLSRLYYLNQSPYAARPSFIFRNMWEFLNDSPYSETGTFNPTTGIPTANRQDNRQNLWAGFIQDDWKVTPNLTLNLGLRYSYFGPFASKQNNLSVAQLGAGSAMISGLTMRQSGELYNSQKKNFGPQFGFAYNPSALNKRMVIRGGFGVSFNQNEIAITANGTGNSPNVLGQTLLGNQIQYQLPSDTKSLYGYNSNPSAISAIGANGLPSDPNINVNVTAFDPNPKTIYTYHYSLDTQFDLTHNWVATVGYQGSIGRHLLLQQNMQAIAAVNGYALNQNLSGVGYYGNKGNSNYNSLLTSLKHNFSKGFQLEAQYVWSKSMDNGSQPYYMDPYPYDLAYSFGRSDYNVKDAFKIFGMYQPTFFHANSWEHTVLDGWTLTGIFNWHTGFPWTPTVPVSGGSLYYRNSPYSTLRPAAYLGGAKHSTSNDAFKAAPGDSASNYTAGKTGEAYFTKPTYTSLNPDPDVTPITATAGAPQAPGVARNSLDGPGYRNVDASIAKAFNLPTMPVLGEHAAFEFRVDAFNLFNLENLDGSSIVTSIYANNFGQVQSGLGARTLDMQARFSF